MSLLSRLAFWLNPLNWIRAVHGVVRGLSIVRSISSCGDCDIGSRGEKPHWEDLCTYHQERLTAAMGPDMRGYFPSEGDD